MKHADVDAFYIHTQLFPYIPMLLKSSINASEKDVHNIAFSHTFVQTNFRVSCGHSSEHHFVVVQFRFS